MKQEGTLLVKMPDGSVMELPIRSYEVKFNTLPSVRDPEEFISEPDIDHFVLIVTVKASALDAFRSYVLDRMREVGSKFLVHPDRSNEVCACTHTRGAHNFRGCTECNCRLFKLGEIPGR